MAMVFSFRCACAGWFAIDRLATLSLPGPRVLNYHLPA
jgi:hypothetical protein